MLETYNSTIPRKLFQYIKELYKRVEDTDNAKRKINITKYELLDVENDDINLIKSQSRTLYMTMQVHYTITQEDGRIIKKGVTELYIPKLVNNVFIIEGKYRIPTNELANDSIMRIYDDKLIINDDFWITFDKQSPMSTAVAHVRNFDGDELTFEFTDDNFIKNMELFKLTELEKNKIKIKLNIEEVGDFLGPDLFMHLIKLGNDKKSDNLIDKKITNTESNLMRMLYRWNTRRSIITRIRMKFNKEEEVYLTDFQSKLDHFFKVADNGNIDIPTTINPMTFDTLKDKLLIPRYTAYTRYMTDIIDAVNTPINNNVNRINELNVCAEVEDGNIFIKCYKYPTGEKVRLNYIEYLTKKVLCNENWDYENKTIKEFDDGKIIVKWNQKDHKDTPEKFKIEFIEPMPDEKLSISSRQIPMINMSDTVRLSMATSMEKQALPVQDSEPRLVSSGHEDEDFLDSTLLVRYSGDKPGKVTAINVEKNQIFIEDEEGSVIFIDIPEPLPGMNNSAIITKSLVKVGDVIQPNQVIAAPQSIQNNRLHLGVNTYVAYMDYLGYTHEDDIVLSESYADKMKHFAITTVTQHIHADDIIRFIRKIGSKVTSQDVLINLDTKARITQELSDMFKKGRKGLLQEIGYEYDPQNLLVPNNCDEAYVIDVAVDLRPEDLKIAESINTVKDFDRHNKSNEYDWLPEEIKRIKAYPVERKHNTVGSITYKLALVKRVKPGDKICNSYGSKGIVGLVLPDHLMPRVDLDGEGNGPVIDLIMNPPGVISRKNPSQIYECALTNCIKAIYERANDLIKAKQFDELRKFLHKFYFGKFDTFSDEELITNHEQGLIGYRMIVGAYTKLNHDIVSSWLKELKVNDKEYIFIPDVVIVQNRNDDKPRAMSPEDYVEQPGDIARKYELGFTEQPVIVGSEYMLKLFHAADYVGKVTSSIVDSYRPAMSRGLYREEGQKIGEMELWALQSYGTEKFVQDLAPNMETSQYQFLNELLSAGYTVVNKNGIPINSGYVNQLDRLAEIGKLGKLKK